MLQASAGSPVVLVKVAPFWLGSARVDPPQRRVTVGDAVETLEPRVMQVLVALVQADGAVVSRDDLIARCWGGRIVSENAINRVISQLRQLGATLATDSFTLETINKVGYRLIAQPPAPAPAEERSRPLPVAITPHHFVPPRPPLWTRRRVLGTGAAVLGAGAGTLALVRHVRARHEPSPAVRELMRRGGLAQREGVPGQTRQAVAFYKQATEQDPNYAEAWGALALAYRHLLEGFGDVELGSLPGLIRSAAGRALALDPDNADAQVALVVIKPYYRNWGVLERELGALAERWPDHWLLQGQLGLLMQEVGRFDEAIAFHQRVNRIDPFLPVSHAFLTRAFSLARRIQEADATIDAALRRWPSHPMLWQMRYNVYLYSARPGAAAAFVQNPETRPDMVSRTDVDRLLLLARAAENRRPTDVAAVVDFLHKMMVEEPPATPSATAQLGLFGQVDLMFAGLERFYFGTGAGLPPIPPPGPYDRRTTAALFAPPVMPYRADRRHAALLERVGLERYWRESGTRPDYRRA